MIRFTQITATSGGEDNMTDVLYALDEQGRVWRLVGASEKKADMTTWHLLPAAEEPET